MGTIVKMHKTENLPFDGMFYESVIQLWIN